MIRVIVEFKIGHREQEAKTYYEGFIGTGETKADAIYEAESDIRLKRDELESMNNFVALRTLDREEEKKLHHKVMKRVRADWEWKLYAAM